MANENYRILDERDSEKQKQENLGFKTDISAIKDNIKEVEVEVDNIQANISSNTTDITALKSTTSNLSNEILNVSKTSSAANQIAIEANDKADAALARNEFTDEEKSKLASLTPQEGADLSDYYNKKQIDDIVDDIQTELSQTTSKATDVYKAMPTINGNISSLQSAVDEKLDSTSRGYVPIRYVTESADFNTDFMLTADDPNKVIFSCPKNIQSTNAPFGSTYLPYILIAERICSNASQAEFIRYTCMAVEFAGTEYANIIEYRRYYKGGTSSIWTEWENISQSSGTIMVDSLLSTTSENPVQNKVITEKIEDIQTELSQTTSKATDVYKAMPTINGYFSDLRNDVAINKTSLGMQKKNLLKLKHLPGYSYTNTSNSVTWTFNDDYSVTMSTTDIISIGQSFEIASVTLQPGTYIYSVEGYSTTSIIHTQLYINDSWNANLSAVENTITVTEEGIYSFRFYRNSDVSSGTIVTIFPMLRYANVTDSTFEPYTESLQEQIDDINTELAQTTSKATDAYKAIPTFNTNISNLQSEVDGLTASVDYMSQYKADTTTVNGVISNVSALTERVETNEINISSNASGITAMQASITKLQENNVQISKDISSVSATATIAQSRADTALSNTETNATDIEELKKRTAVNVFLPNRSLSYSSNGITMTINSDGTFVLNGTATANITNCMLHRTASISGQGRYLHVFLLSGTAPDDFGGIAALNASYGYSQVALLGTPAKLTNVATYVYFRPKINSGDTFTNAKFGVVVTDTILDNYIGYIAEGNTICEKLTNYIASLS